MHHNVCYIIDMQFATANSNVRIVERLNDMNIPVILIEMLIFSILFTVMCFKTSGKNTTVQIHNYPPEIQEEYFKTHERVPTESLSKMVVLTKGGFGTAFYNRTFGHGAACRCPRLPAGISVRFWNDGMDRCI